jgi:D-beta-D-heptose 7-phosphate kinase/D-beta-D-heptose 1-phosphate adenosyltransferase
MLSEKGTRKIVAVIGDIMIDRYLTGRVDRISPEAPVPVLLHSHDRAVAGGAANVAVNIVALGCEVKLVGAVGNDQDAEDLRRILAEAGVSTTLLVTDHSRPTISKTRVVSGRQQFFRIDREFPGRLSAEAEDDLIRAARAAIAEAEVVVLSDYAKASSATMCSSK